VKIKMFCPRCKRRFVVYRVDRKDIVCPRCSMKFVLDCRKDGTFFVTKWLFGNFQDELGLESMNKIERRI